MKHKIIKLPQGLVATKCEDTKTIGEPLMVGCKYVVMEHRDKKQIPILMTYTVPNALLRANLVSEIYEVVASDFGVGLQLTLDSIGPGVAKFFDSAVWSELECTIGGGKMLVHLDERTGSLLADLDLTTPTMDSFIANYPRFSRDAALQATRYDKKNFRNGNFTASNLEMLGFEYSEICNEFNYKDITIRDNAIIIWVDQSYQDLAITKTTELKQFIKIWYGTNN